MDKQTQNIIDKLVDKSQEAFIVAIELYNKPTIRYRVEGFSFFICNSWELLLKAYMIKTFGNDSIYYKDSKQTKSLNVCVKTVFTNAKDPLRQNLEKIIELRNTSTHFITEEYEQIYIPLFQSCVINYINKLLQFFDIDITDKLGSNFLTLPLITQKINQYIFNLFVKFYNLKQDDSYCYKYKNGQSTYYSYSNKAIQLILDCIKKDPKYIVQNLKNNIGKSTPGAKEF